MVGAKSQAGLGSHPEFERDVQNRCGGQVSPLMHPVIAPAEGSPGPETAAQTKVRPDVHRLEPVTPAQPETGADVQQPRAKRQPLRDAAVAPSLPALTPACRPCA